MFLYMSSKKFGQDTKFLKDWINQYDNKIFIIPNALDAKDEEKIQENLKEDIKLLEEIGFCVNIIDLKSYFGKYNELREELSKYNACCVMGGNVKVNYEGIGFVDYLFIPHYKSNYHKVHLIEDLVNKCKNENIKYKAIKDGEVVIEQIK